MILAIVQARCSSTRLPGKVLAPILGVPMILRQLERLSHSVQIDKMVVATSTETSDLPLVEVLTAAGIEVRRGPLADVAARFAGVASEFSPSHIVRLTADCPLADFTVIDRVIASQVESGVDYTSNVIDRTFPQGLDVECFTAAAFARLLARDLTAEEREHVTLGIYRRPSEFSLGSVTQQSDLSHLRWTVDRPDDLEFVRAVYQNLYGDQSNFLQDDILQLLSRRPELNHVN